MAIPMHSMLNLDGQKERVISGTLPVTWVVLSSHFEWRLSQFRMTQFTEQLQAEIDFTEKTLQTYYDANPERAVICHNDVHQGNVMRNKDGELQLDSIILVDFDQAGYGFRMWDILYFLSNLGEMPSDEIVNESLQGRNHLVQKVIFYDSLIMDH